MGAGNRLQAAVGRGLPPVPGSAAAVAVLWGVAGLGAGCAVLPGPGPAAVIGTLEQTAGVVPRSTAGAPVPEAGRLAALLAEPVTPEIAARIAIAGHPGVAAAFARLGLARADLVAGALPAGPDLSLIRVSAPQGGSDALKQAFGIDLLSLLTLPARQAAARATWEAARAQAVGEALLVGGRARSMMIDHVAAAQRLDLMGQAHETAQAALAAAEAIHAAGNSRRVDLDRERLFAAEVALALRAAQADHAASRERMSSALGLSGPAAASWRAVRRLPAPPAKSPATADVEAAVLSASTDRAAALARLEAARIVARSTRLESWLPGLAVEVEREREDGGSTTGSGVHAVLPVPGLGSAWRARAESARALAEVQAEMVDLELRAEARALAGLAEAARAVAVEHRDVLLPLSQSVFEGAQLDFNAMQIGIFQLLEAKRTRLAGGLAAIEATRLYWQAAAALDLLLAGAGPGAASGPGSPARGAGPVRADPGH